VFLERNVYVVGGSDGSSALKSAEMYDPSAGQWRAFPDMSVARHACAAACIDGNVYVVGGHDCTTRHASVECYDPIASEWRTLPSMSAARFLCAAAMGEIGRTPG
jgi:N-acetylneuraminic acid mutarotase